MCGDYSSKCKSVFIHKRFRREHSRLVTVARVAGSDYRAAVPTGDLPSSCHPHCHPTIAVRSDYRGSQGAVISPSTPHSFATRVSGEGGEKKSWRGPSVRRGNSRGVWLFARRDARARVRRKPTRAMRTPRDPVTDWGSCRRCSAAVTRGDTAN